MNTILLHFQRAFQRYQIHGSLTFLKMFLSRKSSTRLTNCQRRLMLLVRHSKKIVRHVRGSDDISTTLIQGCYIWKWGWAEWKRFWAHLPLNYGYFNGMPEFQILVNWGMQLAGFHHTRPWILNCLPLAPSRFMFKCNGMYDVNL